MMMNEKSNPAIHDYNLALFHLLVKKGANLNVTFPDKRTALMYVCEYHGFKQSFNVIKTLIDAGADVNAKDQTDITALMYAVEYNDNIEVIRLLIEAKADVNAVSCAGSRPLELAYHYNKSYMSILQQAGAVY